MSRRPLEPARSFRVKPSLGELGRGMSLSSIQEGLSYSGDESSWDVSLGPNDPQTDNEAFDDDLDIDLADDGSEFVDEEETDSVSRSSRKGDFKVDLAGEQTKQIWTLQRLVKVVLVVAAGLTAAAIYYNLRWEEVDQFENRLKDHASKVITSLEAQLQQSVSTLDALGLSYTTEATLSELSWPFVTLPGFHYQGPSLRVAVPLSHMSFSPVVSLEDRTAWEEYALTSEAWIQTSIDLQPADNVFEVSRDSSGRIRDLQDNREDSQVDSQLEGTSGTAMASHVSQKNGSESVEKPQLSVPTDGSPTMSPSLGNPDPGTGEPVYFREGVATMIYTRDSEGDEMVEDNDLDTYVPYWQVTPLATRLIKYNILSNDFFSGEANETIQTRQITIGGFAYLPSDLASLFGISDLGSEPVTQIYVPVFTDFTDSRSIAGLVTGIIRWSDLLEQTLPSTANDPMICVFETPCGADQIISYRIQGQEATFLGTGDFHSSKFNDMVHTNEDVESTENNVSPEEFSTFSGVTINEGYCPISIRIYPTLTMESHFITQKPLYYTVAVVMTFLITVLMIALLSFLQERRHKIVLESAAQSNAVVSSLFPAVVRDRLLKGKGAKTTSAKLQLKSFLDKGKKKGKKGSKPIADLFPYTTVLFADISGFTAWSSVREPHQVFTLLETVYRAFDKIAKRRHVFKVETIGDCYMAVTGLPDPQDDHAVIMAKFAMGCMFKMTMLTKKLERTLGPDTGDLKMRFGMHSGPTTAGVLRGEKSRFQLFGDTVNTASRMESTGKPNKIQCSQATADLIIAGGKGHWVTKRDEIVKAKGKGDIQTYWVEHPLNEVVHSKEDKHGRRSFLIPKKDKPDRDAISGRSLVWGDANHFEQEEHEREHQKNQRLVDWNVEVLKGLLKQIVVNRARKDHSKFNPADVMQRNGSGSTPRSQVTEAIIMPQYDSKIAKAQLRQDSKMGFDLSNAVQSQLKSYVTAVCMLYHDDNAFHNYEHASHVTMSANKLLKRVVRPDEVFDRKRSVRRLASNLHEYTYGITSDPLTQFAIIFSALIHDVDHCGVSNTQLVREETSTAVKYGNQSVAEQNSIDLAWNLLMDPTYKDLQTAIYANESEFRRFRQLVVNSVMATDIFDKDLKAMRNNRWERAFSEGIDDQNLKATIVIEHIIQAADVSHTMQHWHIYQKWNERLFQEVYGAYKAGRGGEKDPSEGWYNGELWFFDNYVIPLAKKLKECGVFGVASAECLTYALDNRREWAAKGEAIVRRMKVNFATPKWARADDGSIDWQVYANAERNMGYRTEESHTNHHSAGHGDNDSHATGEGSATGLNKDIRKLEMALVVLFVAVSVAVCVGANAALLRNQREEFEESFSFMATDLSKSIKLHTNSILEGMKLITIGITSDSLAHNTQWPLFSVPYFSEYVEDTVNVTDAEIVGFSPVVTAETRTSWEAYSLTQVGYTEGNPGVLFNSEGVLPQNATGPFVPLWQQAPRNILEGSGVTVNADFISLSTFGEAFSEVLRANHTVVSQPIPIDILNAINQNEIWDEPIGIVVNPIFEGFATDDPVVAVMTTVLQLRKLFLSPERYDSIVRSLNVILRDTCGQNYTYFVDAATVEFVSLGDNHDVKYDNLKQTFDVSDEIFGGVDYLICNYVLDIYPTQELRESFEDSSPVLYPLMAAAVFVATFGLMTVHGWLVSRRQRKLETEATESRNFLASMFPAIVHKRLVAETLNSAHFRSQRHSIVTTNGGDGSMERNGIDDSARENGFVGKPIADLFPRCTILFADIVGFTAWSSEREPVHVFTLLETIFRSFDKLAREMHVFKVETIGDCYVAVCGLPHPREDHAVVMASFAKACMKKMTEIVQKLEIVLGPETCTLTMRMGLHSGSVIAGVLRGEKTRFQLFGDSVNTAARIETSGEAGRIHMSYQTAELLTSSGQSRWVVPRGDLITAKGKGVIRTYWLLQEEEVLANGHHNDHDEEGEGHDVHGIGGWGTAAVGHKSHNRLVDWNVDVLYHLLEEVVAKRRQETPAAKGEAGVGSGGGVGLDLRKSLVTLYPEAGPTGKFTKAEIDPMVKEQLRAFVTTIALMYRNHPFHNFQHASHVMLSITKLLSRVVTDEAHMPGGEGTNEKRDSTNDNTYGIAHDPLLRFAVVFSALIHDVDHAGVPNVQLCKEDSNLAKKYRFRSIAEKHSIRLSWERLMDPEYRIFRESLCPNQDELKRFRNFVVNTVMATDIADRDLSQNRADRWEQCFKEWPEHPTEADIHRKAAVIMEHLIQASDVAHTMQHFEVFKKWNKRLFNEVMNAYEGGRAEVNPTQHWYRGELGFFDFYIIPLAKKLGECGVFGVSSDEYLNFATENREKWSREGEELVSLWQKERGGTK
eukprot:Nitzschia sp. Nitz4//scaffold37_size175936//118664//127302//NITZ4_002057-RA/size175936-augustus-gene-0.10-mRNA-1//1//CDS//3329549821//7753//frame0